jgi:methyl-accepting chemotaxis protein
VTRLNDIRVAVRLPFVSAIALLGLVIFAVVSLQTVSTVKVGGPIESRIEHDSEILADIAAPDANLISTDLRTNELYLAIGAADAQGIAEARTRIAESVANFRARVAELEADTEPGSAVLLGLEEIERTGEAYLTILERDVLANVEAGDLGAARSHDVALTAAYETHEAAVDAETQTLRHDIELAKQEAEDVTKSRELLLGALLVATLIVVGVIAWTVTRSVTKPLDQLRRNMDDIASGDGDTRNARLDADRRDEFGQVAGSFNTFADKLVAYSDEAARNAAVAETRAREVASAATVASENMNTVAVATTELSAAASEIARSAGDASRTAENAVHAADHANQLMERLADSSARISQVVESIRGIAAQTTMLALNATIEAARAGEAGRGFAVVASEVKDLAAETGSATADIVSRVDTIQADTQAALVALAEVAQVITEISSSQSVIAAAVEEQAATTAEIDRSLTQAVDAVNRLAGDPTISRASDGHFVTAA